MQELVNSVTELFKTYTGAEAHRVDVLPQSGSDRRYFRLHGADGATLIGTHGLNVPENEAFIYFSTHFTLAALPVPRVLAISTDRTVYLQQDFGDVSLMNLLEQKGYVPEVYNLFKQSLTQLARLQVMGDNGLDYSQCLTNSEFGKQAIQADLLYFKYYFLDALRKPYDKQKLLNDFEAMSNYLTHTEYKFFMFRDFQSRNILVHTSPPGPLSIRDVEGVADARPMRTSSLVELRSQPIDCPSTGEGSAGTQPLPVTNSDINKNFLHSEVQAPSPRGEGRGEAAISSTNDLTQKETFSQLPQTLSPNPGINTQPAPATPSPGFRERGPGGEVFFIDYQGGMKGAPQYDVASLLWQARANLPDAWKESLLNDYMAAFEATTGTAIDRSVFKSQYNGYVLIRLLQVLGAYGFRGLFERKSQFLTSIPQALKNLKWFLENNNLGISVPEFKRVLTLCTDEEIISRFTPVQATEATPLVVKVSSFSYRKGVPVDSSIHGGGFVFDCRGIDNPGRHTQYKEIHGRDKPVMDYLEQQTRMQDFLNSVFDLVDISVEEYIRRGFDALTINFGCTGGQHRSVYAADALTRHLRNKYKVKIELFHREQELKGWKNPIPLSP